MLCAALPADRALVGSPLTMTNDSPTSSPTETSPPPETSLGAKLLLLTLGTAVGLFMAEAVVRVAGLAPEVVLVQQGRFQLSPNPLIGYEPVPNFNYEGKADSFHDYVGTSNSLGFRDDDRSVEKPPGVYRILLLGDSVTAGQGVRLYENTYPAILQQRLTEAGLAVEVLNFAVTGYNTQQEVWTLHDKGLAFDPDLVMVGFCLNDRKRSDGGILSTLVEQERQAQGITRTRSHPWMLRSALYRLARYRLLPTPEEPPEMIHGDTVDESFEFLGQLRDAHGFRVLVTIFPRFGKLLQYRWPEEHAQTHTVAEDLGFSTFDLLPAFQDCRRRLEGKLAHDRYHPTGMGHRCAGDALAAEIIARREELGIPLRDGP